MHSAKLELTKLTYTRLEDNLIRMLTHFGLCEDALGREGAYQPPRRCTHEPLNPFRAPKCVPYTNFK